jgi:hypothetical protein
MFAKHLPPSEDRPRVLALDIQAAADLPTEIDLNTPPTSGVFDAVVGYAAPDPALDNLEVFYNQLRPGGRLILAARAEPKTLLEALRQGGYIHCLVEPQPEGWTLYRGERPREGQPLAEDAGADNADAETARALEAPFFYIPVTQSPNKPAWRLSPGETIRWQAPTVGNPASGEASLLVFSSLLRAVAFMQRAVLAGTIKDINKVGKFANALVKSWGRPFLLNPTFHLVRTQTRGPAVEVDPQVAVAGDE